MKKDDKDDFFGNLEGVVQMPDGTLMLPDGSIVGQDGGSKESVPDDPFERLLAESVEADEEAKKEGFEKALQAKEAEEHQSERMTKGFERVLREENRSTDFELEISGGDRAQTWINESDDEDEESE